MSAFFGVLLLGNSIAFAFAQGRYLLSTHLNTLPLGSFPGIIHGPESKTVYLNQTAVFTCETNGHFSYWMLNGTLLYDLPPGDWSQGSAYTAAWTILIELSIIARAEYNGTIVECLTVLWIGRQPLVETENATLNIQGTRKH